VGVNDSDNKTNESETAIGVETVCTTSSSSSSSSGGGGGGGGRET